MLKISNAEVGGFEGAFRGMRNPKNSWDKSDSYFGFVGEWFDEIDPVVDAWVYKEKPDVEWTSTEYYDLLDKYTNWLCDVGTIETFPDGFKAAFLGPKDLELAQTLITAGTEHGKFLRQIYVSMDITAPLYWWKEMDTYKIGTTADSQSTMHKLMEKEFTMGDFNFDYPKWGIDKFTIWQSGYGFGNHCPFTIDGATIDDIEIWLIHICNKLREQYLGSNDPTEKEYCWRALVQILPSAYKQTRTWTANYAVLRNIYHQRKNHKLTEWHEFCDQIKALPWAEELICFKGEKG